MWETGDVPFLDNRHTVFEKVIKRMGVIQKIGKAVKDKTFNSIGITAFQRFLIPCGHSTPDLKDVEY